MVKKNACVFISGRGSNLNNLIKKSRDYNFPIKIKLVICNNDKAPGIIYAKKNTIPFIIIDTKARYFEYRIINALKEKRIDLILLAGYMKIISKKFLGNFKKVIINIHPSLLPKYKGLNTYTKVIKNKEKRTGCSVHYVNEKLDSGRIIIQKSFYVSKSDDEISLKNKTQKMEYLAFPEAIYKIYKFI